MSIAGIGPTLIEAMTYRYEGHFGADDTSQYRDSEEEEYYRDRDCIKRLITLLEIEKDEKSIVQYVKNLSDLLNTDLSFDGQTFKLEGKNVKQSEIQNTLLAAL